VRRSAFGVELVGMARDIAEKAQRMGCEARPALRGFNGAAQAPRIVEPAAQ
jgi:hypothetical protein